MTEKPPEVVIAGGGIAALELVFALRELAGDRVRITLVAPEPDFVLRPMLVAEPLGAGVAQRRPLRQIAADAGFRLVPAAVASVDPAGRRVVLASGDTLPYDTLVLAMGARTVAPFDDAIVLGDPEGVSGLAMLRDEVREGIVRSVAFVAPTLAGWLLPLYEAALLTASAGGSVRASLITPEQRPLELFGHEASTTVERLLAAAGIEFTGSRHADTSSLVADRVVTLPLLRGRQIPGVPATGPFGLIAVDGYGRVDGLPGVYAAGDATDFGVKQGALAALQADAVATHIAARHGAAVTPSPFRPVLRALLVTGDGPVALGAAGGDEPTKLPGRYLAPYLESHARASQPVVVPQPTSATMPRP